MKRIFYILALLVTLLYANIDFVTISATEVAEVNYTYTSVKKGENVEIIINVKDCPSASSMGIAFEIDDTKLEFVSAEWLLSDSLLQDWNSDDGVILFSSEQNINGNVARCIFKILEIDSWENIKFDCKVVIKNNKGIIPVNSNSIELVIACNHVWNNEIMTEDSTCSKEGYIYHSCSICHRIEKLDTISKLGHTISDWIVKIEPTLENEGSRIKECIICHEVLQTESMTKLELPPSNDDNGGNNDSNDNNETNNDQNDSINEGVIVSKSVFSLIIALGSIEIVVALTYLILFFAKLKKK